MSSSTRNLSAGLLFLAIAAFFGFDAWNALEIGSVGTMGPGYFPVMISLALALMGVLVIVAGGDDGAEVRPMPWRALVFIVGAPVAFGLTVRPLGLVPALLITVTLSVLASRRISFVRGAAIVIGMTAFSIAVFSYGIGLSVELFNSPPSEPRGHGRGAAMEIWNGILLGLQASR